MIELTVKTLDSQNHQFSVDDDITVEQFKVKIAETVNIPPETQRIIYCGRVLQDTSKLADYDVHGKVVHLVQRAPPGNNQRPTSRSASPQPQRRAFRGFRGLDQANAMYLGSMAFPGNLMESQGIVPPPPTHSLSGSRLNVAKRMLRRADAVLTLLENPSARPQEQNPSDENQEEEVTPVIEARVIVPNNNEPIDEVLSAVQNSLIDASTGAIPLNDENLEAGGSGSHSNTESAQRSPNPSETSTPAGATPRSSSTENLNTDSRLENGNSLPENASRTSEMAELLTMLGALQTRFAPFLERYQNFMQEDPEISEENQRQTQTMLNRVSEVLHFLGHAYHSLSDIIIRVRTPPPRPLLCRPILIQHSAVVQTGIPIQVEAQINLSADRAPTSTANATQGAAAGTNSTTNTTTSETPPTTATTNIGSVPAPNGAPTISVQPGFVGLPFLPGAAMRVQSFPVEIRTMRSGTAPPRSQNDNNNTVNASESTNEANPSPNRSSAPPPTAVPPGSGNRQNPGTEFNFNNPNVEFFMEVTPEGITIDSLETTLVGSNQANDLLRGALNGPPPEFLQSLMQMAGQIINRNISTATTTVASTESTQSTTGAQASATSAGQNSQARGNTQTHPTTATHTRSTPRPHVHLAQQAMQGGFDPFLPCNSHHISRRTRLQAAAQAAATATPTNNQQSVPPNTTNASAPRPEPTNAEARGPAQNQNIMNFVNGIFESIRRHSGANAQAAPNANAGGSGVGDGPNNSSTGQNVPLIASIFTSLGGGGNLPDVLGQGPTLEHFLQQFQLDYQYVPGESIITDLQMLFIRNLTLVDLFAISSGNVEPINRNINEIQNFVRSRLCNNDTTPNGIDRAIDNLMTELQPFLENFRSLPSRDDIDIVRSAEQLLRQRLPNIISICLNLNPNNIPLLVHQCITTGKQLLALTLRSTQNGQVGVEQVFERVVNRLIEDVPQDLQNFTLMTSNVQFRQILANLSVPDSVLQPYIVRRSEVAMSSVIENQQEGVGDNNLTTQSNNSAQDVEPMELDEQEATGSELGSPTIMLEDTEPLPSIVLGSEPWHGQVPEDWVPIITRDAQKQRRQNTQGPFSDAYLSGMPSKRRKIVNSTKPQGSLPQVITDSVRQAVTATGLTNAAPLDTVAQLAGASPEIQSAYRNLLRSTVQASLRDNEDFIPERFPNAANYFNTEQ